MIALNISHTLRFSLRQHAVRVSMVLSLLGCFSLQESWADPVLPNLIGDHMVLQRDREIHIWGSADPGEDITVTFAGNSNSSKTDSAGHWFVLLPPMAAGGPFALTIRGKKTIALKDVMIGEVWVASGQSNMTFALSGAVGGAEEVKRADYPQIRLFTVPKRIALQPQPNTLPATWQICSPQSAKDFSAVGYYFARDLHKNLGVPIGVIESAWPGTTIEEWIDPEAMREDANLNAILDQEKASKSEASPLAGSRLPFELEFDDFELLRAAAAGEALPFSNFDDGSTKNATGGDWGYDWQGAPDTAFELVAPGRGGKGFAARISGALDESDNSRLTARFKLDGSPMDLSSYSGIRFWVRGNGQVRVHTLQPTITDYDDYSTSLFHASVDWQPITVWFRDLRQEGWGVSLPFTQNAQTGFSIESLTSVGYSPLPVSGLFEGMIAPLLPYPFRGVIWYQGESNALKAHQYRTLLPALITGWRKASRNIFPFLIVQLPNHGAVPEQPTESAWAELREAQLLTARQLPDTGIAVTIDVGDPKDVHPHRKAEVGHRLALWALGTTYAKPIVYSGPLYRAMEIQGSKIRIRFSNVGSGLEANGGAPLRGFAIAGAGRKFHWADASIEGDSVVVSSSQVPAPLAVRYAWADSPPCNLFNKEGLPASPFRTDQWRGITGK